LLVNLLLILSFCSASMSRCKPCRLLVTSSIKTAPLSCLRAFATPYQCVLATTVAACADAADVKRRTPPLSYSRCRVRFWTTEPSRTEQLRSPH
jgi:hypothetical protein